MIETLNQTQAKLYSRAVDPAVESRLRTRENQELTPSAQRAVQDRQARVQQERQQQTQYEQTTQGQGQVEQRAKDMAEQLSQALRQARQTPAKYKPTFSLETTTGRRANQSYLSVAEPKSMRVVDEIA